MDCKVSPMEIEVRTGRKWSTERAEEVAESHLRFAWHGAMTTRKPGFFLKTQVSKAFGK